MSKIPSLAVDFTANASLRIGRSEIDLVELTRCLRTLADTQSITAAANTLGVTYRTMWGRMLSFDDALDCKLIGKARGRGTQFDPDLAIEFVKMVEREYGALREEAA